MSVSVAAAARDTWQLLIDRARTESDPRLRGNLEVVASHVEAEVAGDIPALMATLVAEPRYQVWGASSSPDQQGHVAVEKLYADAITSGKNRLEFVISRVMVERDAVLTEGTFRHAYDGATIVGRGFATPDAVDSDGWYLVEYRALILWPIDPAGLIEGEEMYAGETPRIVRRLQSGEHDHLGPVGR